MRNVQTTYVYVQNHFFVWEAITPAPLMKKKSSNNLTPANTRETSGGNLKEGCVTQLLTPHHKVIFVPLLHKNPSVQIQLVAWMKRKPLHLGEELGLWGTFGPPCSVRTPWQLSVTSRQMMAVLPEPALPTMTAPRPSQLLFFFRTSSRRVKSQSRPTKGVSAVMPGTSNSSGFSIMSACLNGTSLPAQIETTTLKLRENFICCV